MSDFTIYSKDNCPFCERAKNIIKTHGYSFTELKVHVDITKEQIQEAVNNAGSTHEVRSVPQIFKDDEYIGGYQQLVQYFNN
jgi:glutaredoxin